MKKWPYLGVCLLIVAACITGTAEESEPEAKVPKAAESEKANGPSLGAAATEVANQAPNKSKGLDDLDVRLSKLEMLLNVLMTQLAEEKAKLATKDDVEKLIEQKVRAALDSKKTGEGQGATSSATPNVQSDARKPGDAVLLGRVEAIEKRLSDLDESTKEIAGRLGVAGIKSKQGSIIDELKSPLPTDREGWLIVRNYTGDDQSLYVGGREFRMPGNGREYEIPVKLTGNENSVVTQVWPYDKPKVRQFKLSDGRLESRFDITLQPVR